MLFKSIPEAVAFLENMERPDGVLMRRVMAVLYRLDRAAFELLVENILIKQYGRIAHSAYEAGFVEYACRWPSLDVHFAYTLFHPADFESIISAASNNPHISSFTVYAQEGFEPSPKELGRLAEQGISINHIGIQGLADFVLRLDLVELIQDMASEHEPENGNLIASCLHSLAGEKGVFEAMDFLLRQIEETEFPDLLQGLLLRRGFIGKRVEFAFHGVDDKWQPFIACAQHSPTQADFEEFYREAKEKQQTSPKLRAWFFYSNGKSPEFVVREAERDPNSLYGHIEDYDTSRFLHFFNDYTWLRRWLMHRFGGKEIEACE